VRIDVALFELRLYKSRSQATAAIQAGHVSLNGARIKASHALAVGDRIAIAGRPGALEVLELPRAGLSRDAAKALLREVPAG
jgi:ribosome-associated heat shock protein Hsp15